MIRALIVLACDLLILLAAPYVWWRRAHACPRGAWLRIEIDGPIVEIGPRTAPWVPRGRPTSIEELRDLARLTLADPRVAGWLVVIRSFAGGTTRATALRRVLATLRAGGKRVVVHLPEGGGTRVTFVAVAADRILVGPHAHVAPLGFAVEAHYLKGALDAMGVEPEVLARGRYKTAGERLVASEMSAEQREQLEALLDVAHDELVAALAEGRGASRERAERWVNEGPWTARSAVEQGLADAEAYADELPTRLAPEREGPAPIVPARRYARRRRRALAWPGRRPHVAVIELEGSIVHAPPWPGLPVATEAAFAGQVERVRTDRAVRGVILLVDSPGGSVLVSDRMLHEVRRLAAEKPVVACLGDVAASGGYLVALGAHAIVAEATTITGSIGVVAVRFAIGALLERVGVGVEVVKRGERADLHSPARPLSTGERAALEREIGGVYDAFVDEVARSRRLDPEVVRLHAEGRVFSGSAALERGLVDAIGGLPRALAAVRERVGRDGARLEVALAPRVWRVRDVIAPAPFTALGRGAALRTLGVALAAGAERIWLWRGLELTDRGAP